MQRLGPDFCRFAVSNLNNHVSRRVGTALACDVYF